MRTLKVSATAVGRLLLLALLVAALPARADLKIDITKGVTDPIPIAIVAFARQHGTTEGHVFALVVMVVAAAEVVVGLGIVVAMYRNRVPVDVDELRELHG